MAKVNYTVKFKASMGGAYSLCEDKNMNYGGYFVTIYYILSF